MDPSGRRWISVREAAELYSLHPKTVARLCSLRKIPFSRLPSSRGVRGGIRIDKIACDRMLESGLVVPAEAPPLDRRRHNDRGRP